VIHAIWTLQGLGAFHAANADSEAVVEKALAHPSAAVRKNAVMALTESGGEAALQLAAGLIDDPDAKTRLKAVIALGLLPPSETTAASLYARRHTLPKDPWIGRAYAHAVLENGSHYLAQLLNDTTADQASVVPLYPSIEEVPDYLVLKRHIASFTDGYIPNLDGWESWPSPTLSLMSLALLEVWKDQLHAPSTAEVAMLQSMVDRVDATTQMRLKLRSPGLALNFGQVQEQAYADYVQAHTFEPNIWGWGRASTGAALYAQHCVSCHGAEAHGDRGLEAPSLAGMENWYLQTQLQKFHAGIRGVHFKNPRGIAMRGALAFLNAEADPNRSVSHLAHYLTELPAHSPEATIDGDVRKGESFYAMCVPCHGDAGQGNRELNAPKLTGKQDWYILKHLQGFRDGVRGADPRDISGGQMAAIAQALPDDAGLRDLVAYIQSLNTK
jgi:cbb3-type cytochrome c oxidase subunit III